MDSQKNSASPAPATTDSEEARRRFLASMGIEDAALEESAQPAESTAEVDSVDDEVALSSQPDDLELPGVSYAVPDRGTVQSAPAEAGEVSELVAGEAEVAEVVEPFAEVEVEAEAEEAPLEMESAPPELEEEPAPEPVSESASPAEETQSESMNHADGTDDSPLQLHCPKCQGELVLMPEHVGIEGACVWCEIKIVAARSGADGEVRVFPLFQPDPVQEVTPAVEKAEEQKPIEVPQEEVTPAAEIEPEPSLPETSREESEPPLSAAEAGESTAASQWSGSGFDVASSEPSAPSEEASGTEELATDFSGGFGSASTPAHEMEKAESPEPSPEAEPAAETPSGFETASPFSGDVTPSPALEPATQEDPAPSIPAGFGEPQGFSETPATADFPSEPAKEEASLPETGGMPEGFGGAAGFSEKSAAEAPVNEAKSEPATPDGFANGFSADPFGESMAPAKEEAPAPAFEAEKAADFSESWGASPSEPDEAPAGFSGSPFADASPEKAEESDGVDTEATAAGFSDPAPWGSTDAEEEKQVSDAPPAPAVSAEDEAPKAVDEPSGFQSGFAASPEPAESASPESSMWGDSDAASASWGESDATPAKEPEAKSPAAPGDEAPSGFGSGFAIPASDQSAFPSEAAPSVETASAEAESIFSDASDDSASPEAEIESWGAKEEVEAPAPAVSDEPLFSADESAESGEEVFAAAETKKPAAPSLFGAPSDSGSTPPPVPTQENDSAVAKEDKKGGLFGAAPTVTSQPLGSKPAKKRGKGMVVMLVILLGLVCGAALASFVLPVNEYVEKARSFVEQKLNMEPEVDPALFLSEMVSPGTGAGASSFEEPPASPAEVSPNFDAALDAATPPVSPAPEANAVTPPTTPEAAPAAPAATAPQSPVGQ